MRRNTVTVLFQGIAACVLWVCGLQMVQAAPAQTTQDTQAEKTSKARKSKKAATDAVSSQPAAPVAGEKTPATRKPKKSAADATSTGSASRAQIGEEKEAANASGAEIRSAKVGGKVWVNTDSGVYHKSGRWYGATKEGKFMTEQEAMRAGYKPAKNEK